MLDVYIACKDEKEAERISKILLKKRLAACANIFSGVKSLYWWRGSIEESREAVIIAKTIGKKKGDIIKAVRSNHSYEIPCIAFISVEGEKDYAEWVKKETNPKKERKKDNNI